MDENDIYEAMGLTPPEGGAENDLAPGDDLVEEDGLESGSAEEPAPEPAEEQSPEHKATPPQDQAAQQAAERLRAEEIDRLYADAYAGQVNPYTGQPIRSKADHDALKQQMAEAQKRQRIERLTAAGIDPADIEALVAGHPAIQQAEQLIAVEQARQEEHMRAEAKTWYEGQMREIASIDPEMTDLEALKANNPETFQSMMELVSRGVSLVEAFKMKHFDALMQRRGAAAAQQERNRAAGKAHLVPTKGVGTEEVEVPADVRARYLDLMPDMTDKEMRDAYAKYLKTKPTREE